MKVDKVLVRLDNGGKFLVTRCEAKIMQVLISTDFDQSMAAYKLGVSRQRISEVKRKFEKNGANLERYRRAHREKGASV